MLTRLTRVYLILLLLASLLIAIGSPAYAQTTCAVGASGVAPTASINFTPPTLNTDGSSVVTPLTYNLYQSTSTGTEIKVASALKGSPISVSTGLTSKTTFYFKVSVTDANGNESSLSNEVCKTFPASVPGTITITIS